MSGATGASQLCARLEARGVRHVFGIVGTQNVELFEALRRSRIRAVAATHELAAGFMANGYYRASGEPGVLITIPGPGFAYALPALAEARLDSCAVVHLVGKPTEKPTPRFQLQDIPQRAMAEPLVKKFLAVSMGSELAAAVDEAFEVARAGEPGPVVVEIARSVLAESWDPGAAVPAAAAPAAAAPAAAAAAARPAAASQDWNRAVEAVAGAKRIALYVGQGVNGADGSLAKLAEALEAPVFLTTSARGALPEDHRLAVPLDRALGGWDAVNGFLAGRDHVLALGVKLSHNGTGGFRLRLPKETLVRVDASAEVLDANFPARISAVGDAGAFLEACLRAVGLNAAGSRAPDPDWPREREKLVSPAAGGALVDDAAEPRFADLDPPTASGFFAALRRALPREGILVTDSGLHQLLARKHFPVLAPRGLLAPTDFQSMGFAIPAATAARLAAPDRPVVALLGDAGFAMTGLELLAAAREELPFAVVVFNDGHDGLIRMKQLQEYGRAFATDVLNPDFEALARSLGIAYARLEGDPAPALASAIASRRLHLLEVRLGDSPQLKSAKARGAIEGILGDTLTRGVKRVIKKVRGGGS